MEIKFTKFAQTVALGLGLALTFSCSSSDDNGGNDTQFTDVRDGKKYAYVKIGSQTWMAENLNYNASGSRCYDNQESICDTYGRLYNWTTAKTVCPKDWHLPNNEDWLALMKYINPICDYEAYYCADVGTKLKATSGWYLVNGIPKGTDDYGFAALPGGGGYRDDEGDYDEELGIAGYWWTASDYSIEANSYGITYGIGNEFEDVFWTDEWDKSNLLSVRCIKD